jgi:hypothetical protein
VNAHAYVDACSLLSWASARLPGCDPQDQAVAAYVEALVAVPQRRAAASAITLMEFYDNAATWFRGGRNGATEQWLDDVMDDLHAWQADGRLSVLEPAPKLYERAMHYVRLNTQPDKRKFRAMDAAHLVQAVRWSRELREQVDLISWDSDFAKLIQRHVGFSPYVVQVDPRTGTDLTARS